MPMPDMTNWPPEYIREYLADQQKAFEADQRANRALGNVPPDDSTVRQQMSPADQIRYLDALQRQRQRQPQLTIGGKVYR